MDNNTYFLSTLAIGLLITHLITPYPDIIFKSKEINENNKLYNYNE